MHNREAYTEFVEKTYFGNVESGQLDAIMACFDPDATVIIRHGDNPERCFCVSASADETPLVEFYKHLCSNYEARFNDFQHFIDRETQRASCYFKVRLKPKPEGLYAGTGQQELFNCNFFEFRDDLITHMIIYYANPRSGDPTSGSYDPPTGYPKV